MVESTPNRKGAAMPLINGLRINGRVATEPAQQGKGPTKFRLAHGGGGKRKDGTPWPVQFFSVIVWDKALLEGLSRGRQIEISGKLRDASYVKDGVTRSAVEIIAESIQIEASAPSPPPLTPDPNRKSGTEIKTAHGVTVTDADIPF